MKKSSLLTSVYAVWAITFIVFPIVLILGYGFTKSSSGKILFDLAGFKDFFSNPIYLTVLFRSLFLAFIATAICLLLGYPMALILSKMKPRHKSIASLLFVLPMWMNFLIRTYGWLSLLENKGLINMLYGNVREWLITFIPAASAWPEYLPLLYNSGAVVLGMVYDFLPFMVFPIFNSIDKLDKSLLEASGDLGANKWQSFWKVTFPLSLPGVISGISMVFIPAITTFIISTLLGGGHVMLIGDIIETQFLGVGDWHFGSAISIIVIAIILIFMLITSKFESDSNEGGSGLW